MQNQKLIDSNNEELVVGGHASYKNTRVLIKEITPDATYLPFTTIAAMLKSVVIEYNGRNIRVVADALNATWVDWTPLTPTNDSFDLSATTKVTGDEWADFTSDYRVFHTECNPDPNTTIMHSRLVGTKRIIAIVIYHVTGKKEYHIFRGVAAHHPAWKIKYPMGIPSA